ncbi:MAG: DUF1501 domain-containing protein [Phycisphaeraceae bacterium]|nr:DUF1501 domain-containing protein [Phycisphaeraceae bacterium]
MSDQSKIADLVHQEYEKLKRASRRQFLGQVSMGLGAAALGSLMSAEQAVAAASKTPLSPLQGSIDPLHFAPKAKRVIFLCMAGGPSHLETFDHKPQLAKMDGKAMPESYTKGQPIAQLQGKELKAMGPQKKFSRHGKSGLLISDWLPHIGSVADEICVVKSMVTEQINHDPAHTFMNTGTAISGRPSMGSWVNYGLGSMTEELPGFCVLVSEAKSRNPQPIASRQWSSGFLPSKYSGVELNSIGDPVHYVKNPPGISRTQQEHLISAVKDLNRLRDQEHHDPEIESRIAQYELAFKMQMAVPELTDLADEPKEVLEMYGATPGDGTFASNCLMARRLAERGVRFIHLYHRGWDHHDGLIKHMDACCKTADQATAALIKDLKQRGMLEDTLVVWGGEFGRTPMSQRGSGRDHHIKGFSMFMAGGGVKGGTTYGETDELGYHAVEDIVNVRDLHATMLHLLGIDHQRLTVKYQGLDVKLTGVEHGTRVVKDIIA